MCGIVGIASRSPVADSAWLAAARDVVCHRGPDDRGLWWSSDCRVGLAHRRLAIIDITAAGHQPMEGPSGDSHIVFNGEIYNFREVRAELESRGHRFRSQSDTEVILAAYREWETDCLDHLSGMFSFGLYDEQRRRLFLARDRAGEKPLFYARENGTIRFASELKALLTSPSMTRSVDHEALDCYLSMGFVPGERCIVTGARKLPAGHALLFDVDKGDVKVWCYWTLPPATPVSSDVDEVGLVDEIERLLQSSVERQMVADVPIGVMLSGGIDSSLVTAMAVRSHPRVKTFTVRFPGYGAYDETDHGRLIARHFGTDHTELEAGDTSVDLLPRLARQFDEPIIDSSMVPTYLVSSLIREHCTVALGGDGGDELFGGYGHYSRLLWMQQKFGSIPQPLRSLVGKSAEHALPTGVKGRNWLQGLAVDLRKNVPPIATYFDPTTRKKLMGDDWRLECEQVRAARIPASNDLLDRATRMDFQNYLVEDILVKVDRASMLNSLETRAPFLDHRIIEFAFGSVPSRLKATVNHRKILLKKLALRILPAQFDAERKQGFSIPLAAWLKTGSWQRFFREVLLDSSDTPFNRKTVADLLSGQDRGRANGERLFGLVMFELWRRSYGLSV